MEQTAENGKRMLAGVFLAVAVLGMICGCGTHRDVDARFDVYNSSPKPVTFVVNANVERPMVANTSRQFIISVPIPYQPYYHRSFGTGPSVLDEWVTVDVSFRVNGILLPPESCSAGAKVATQVTYYESGGYQYIDCRSARGEKQEGSGSQ